MTLERDFQWCADLNSISVDVDDDVGLKSSDVGADILHLHGMSRASLNVNQIDDRSTRTTLAHNPLQPFVKSRRKFRIFFP